MLQCSRCGTIYDESAACCPHCGANAPVYCAPPVQPGYPPQGQPGQSAPPPQGYGQPPVPTQQQGYAPPPANPYGQPPVNPYYAPPPIVQPPYNGMAIGGFVLACVSLILCCFPITSIVGLVLSIISMPQIDRRGERGKGLAVAGIVLNALVVLGWLVMFILSLAGSLAF